MKLSKVFKTFLNITLGIISILLIAFVNFQIISSWIKAGNGPSNLGSIEVSYVSMARFLRDFGLTTWAPFWYLGFPFHLFYTPLLPILEFLVHVALSIDLWQSYRLITGISYILAPISLFFLGWQLSKRFIGGLLTGLLYSVIPTVFYFLDGGVAADRFSLNFWDPRRFTILVRWGEGPHTLSLVFVPLVGVFFAKYLSKRRFRDLVFSSIFLGLVALSNALGMFASLLLIVSMIFAKFVRVPSKKRIKVFISPILVVLIGLGLISFWYNISFLTNFFGEGESSANIYLSLFPWGWVAGVLGIGIWYIVIKKVIKNFGLASALLWFIIVFTVVVTYYKGGVELLPQALRYNTEVDLALSLLIGVFVGYLAKKLGEKHVALEIFITVITFIIAIIIIIYIQPFIPVASKAGGTVVDLETTGEARIAKWLDGHIAKEKGERVFVPGNYGFYLNYFTDVWQTRGGLFQAATHPWPDHIHYQLANGRDPEISAAWLKIVNAKYAVITTGASNELYKEIKNRERFENFPEVYNEKGDIIYQVPLKRPSLAKPVDLELLSFLAPPKKADDKQPLLAYASWLENSSENETSFEVKDFDNYKIIGRVGEQEGILIQMTADNSWKAFDQYGNKLSIQNDPLGYFVIMPKEAGEIEIALKHQRSWEVWLGYGVSLAIIGIIILYGLSKNKFRHPMLQKP